MNVNITNQNWWLVLIDRGFSNSCEIWMSIILLKAVGDGEGSGGSSSNRPDMGQDGYYGPGRPGYYPPTGGDRYPSGGGRYPTGGDRYPNGGDRYPSGKYHKYI